MKLINDFIPFHGSSTLETGRIEDEISLLCALKKQNDGKEKRRRDELFRVIFQE